MGFRFYIRLVSVLFVACSLSACHEKHFNPNASLKIEDYDDLRSENLEIHSWKVEENLSRLAKADNDSMYPDRRTRYYYLSGGHMLWITREGLSPQADSLLYYINKVEEVGFSKKRFRVKQIERDMQRWRNHDFSGDNDVSQVAARLDYNLTKAYLRYLVGMRYGFVNPNAAFNKLDGFDDDSTHTHFRQLYDVKTETVGPKGYRHIFGLILKDSVAYSLRDAEPKSEAYNKLKAMLHTTTGYEHDRVMANMERLRWRQGDYKENHEKYVVVNIPSYQLICYDKGDVMEMKMVCGSKKTKTPLLYSRIMRIDINPQWNMPFSIVKKDVADHAGNADYFTARNYVIRDNATGERVNPSMLSAAELRSGAYRVIQQGGEGNALGRIIFRFKNNFSIYLHDTSTKSTFGRNDRSASHGCIRVEKPYELAEFLLDDKDEDVLDKIRYSMTVHTQVPDDADADEYRIDKSRIIHSLEVKPEVPVFITYQTLFFMPGSNQLRSYADVYGYDSVIAGILRNYE